MVDAAWSCEGYAMRRCTYRPKRLRLMEEQLARLWAGPVRRCPLCRHRLCRSAFRKG